MKVSSTPAQPSALETWLHEADHQDAASKQATGLGAATAVSLHGTASSRDGAEGLLGLEIWDADPSAGRSLLPSVSAPDALTAGSAQLWATHIFAPLV
jgi:hypothetical protein